jgi:hypothetical protein
MMQYRRHIFKWLFALWMLCCIGSVSAVSQVSAPAAWRTTPTLSADIYPSYQFRSTSTYAPVVGTTSYLSTSTTVYTPGASEPYRAKKEWEEGDPEGQEVGFIDTPVGEPFILLLFAFLMSIVIYTKKRVTAK